MDPPPPAIDVVESITLSKDQLKGTVTSCERNTILRSCSDMYNIIFCPASFSHILSRPRHAVYLFDICILLVLRKAFDAFDTEKCGKITCDNINVILDMLGHATDTGTVKKIVAEIDHQGTTAAGYVVIKGWAGVRGLDETENKMYYPGLFFVSYFISVRSSRNYSYSKSHIVYT